MTDSLTKLLEKTFSEMGPQTRAVFDHVAAAIASHDATPKQKFFDALVHVVEHGQCELLGVAIIWKLHAAELARLHAEKVTLGAKISSRIRGDDGNLH